MAAYREHLTTSCVLGIGVASSAIALGFTPVQGVLGGTITGLGGILPDLDSESGRPVREIFGVTAALVPIVMIRHLLEWGGNTDGAMLLCVMLYVSVKYGGAMLLGVLAVHRGMFHSIPAMLIAGEVAYLGYKSEQISMKLLMGVGIMIGFFSHLVLDELYAVEWHGLRVKLNKFAGSAVKFSGRSYPANIFAYGLLFTLSYTVWVDGGLQKGLDDFTNSHFAQPAPEEVVNEEDPESVKSRPKPPAVRTRPSGRLAIQDDDWRDSDSRK
ncbi:MAG: hypothetical protein JWN70_2565 [Planctomycetaceae bacterium]|nr:hypothetical protein [Planctomycetaceae bacterium]